MRTRSAFRFLARRLLPGPLYSRSGEAALASMPREAMKSHAMDQ